MNRGDCRHRQAGRSVCEICLNLHAIHAGLMGLSDQYNETHIKEDIQLLKDILKTWTPSSYRAMSFDEAVKYMIITTLMEQGVIGLE